MSNIFSGCSSLSSLPDISKWNTNNVTDMYSMFSECSSLSSLPDISKWNTNKVTDMSHMFYYCSSLSLLPNISKWNTNNVSDMNDMFFRCTSLSSIFDFSKIYRTKSLSSLFDGFYKIFIKTITGKTIFIYSTNNDTIQNIKNSIKIKKGIPLDLQILFFNEQQLEDSKTLKDYNIQNMSTLHLVLINLKEFLFYFIISFYFSFKYLFLHLSSIYFDISFFHIFYLINILFIYLHFP